jgi:hypothetical protein
VSTKAWTQGALLALVFTLSLVACWGGSPDREDRPRDQVVGSPSAVEPSASTPSSTPPGVITLDQLERLARAVEGAETREETLAQLAFAQALFYNCKFFIVNVSGKFAGVGANCGGQWLSRGGRPK